MIDSGIYNTIILAKKDFQKKKRKHESVSKSLHKYQYLAFQRKVLTGGVT